MFCSVLTPLLLLLLAKRLGLAWAGQAALIFYLIFDPMLLQLGSLAHLESFLTLTCRNRCPSPWPPAGCSVWLSPIESMVELL